MPEALTPVATLMLPLEPEEEPVVRVAAPLAPEPVAGDDMRLRLPEPVEVPTPVDTLMLPPWPVEEVLRPADTRIEPPVPLSEVPT